MYGVSKLTGAAFDRAYVDHEVTYHQQVLDAIDQVLLPNASIPELKALITSVRPVIASHLQHAKLISDAARGRSACNRLALRSTRGHGPRAAAGSIVEKPRDSRIRSPLLRDRW